MIHVGQDETPNRTFMFKQDHTNCTITIKLALRLNQKWIYTKTGVLYDPVTSFDVGRTVRDVLCVCVCVRTRVCAPGSCSGVDTQSSVWTGVDHNVGRRGKVHWEEGGDVLVNL